jgi:Protein of unknown function (DUF3616)
MRARFPVLAVIAIAVLGSGPQTRRIVGGDFEASGVAHVPNSNQMLVVDDESEREVFAMELRPDGAQQQPVTPVSLAADVTDPEGITFDGRYFYVVGSQSKQSGFDGDGLVRFAFDPRTRRAGGVERIRSLKAWLAANVPELRGAERRSGDDVLNIEGVAWDPAGQRLLLGLRAPVVDGSALVVPVRLADASAPFSSENLRVDGAALRVPLDGDGIRSIEYDEQVKAFRLISGASLDREDSEFRVLEWDGRAGSRPRPIMTFAREQKPEGIARAALDQRPVTVIVFDTGRFAVVE